MQVRAVGLAAERPGGCSHTPHCTCRRCCRHGVLRALSVRMRVSHASTYRQLPGYWNLSPSVYEEKVLAQAADGAWLELDSLQVTCLACRVAPPPCPALPCPALPCPALPCPAASAMPASALARAASNGAVPGPTRAWPNAARPGGWPHPRRAGPTTCVSGQDHICTRIGQLCVCRCSC